MGFLILYAMIASASMNEDAGLVGTNLLNLVDSRMEHVVCELTRGGKRCDRRRFR